MKFINSIIILTLFGVSSCEMREDLQRDVVNLKNKRDSLVNTVELLSRKERNINKRLIPLTCIYNKKDN